MSSDLDPLRSPAPNDIPLRDSPLAFVLGMVRFEPDVALETLDGGARLQQALRDVYPKCEEQVVTPFPMQGSETHDLAQRRLWTLSDEKGYWKVIVARDVLSLWTSAYSSREDFLTRFEHVVSTMRAHFAPGSVQQLGVRYVNRLVGEALEELAAWVRPELRVLGDTPLAGRERHIVSDALFALPEEEPAVLRLRWGTLPPGTSLDPAAIPPVDEPSWVLDLDAIGTFGAEAPLSLDPEAWRPLVRSYARRIYAVFRWCVTSDFLAAHADSVSSEEVGP